MRRGSAALLTLAGMLLTPGTAMAAGVDIDVLSNRADLVSGGDALVAISVPAGRKTSELKVTSGRQGRHVAVRDPRRRSLRSAAHRHPQHSVRLRAQLRDRTGATIELVGHPNGGPVFSGPQLQPWICQPTAIDTQCNEPPDLRTARQGTRGLHALRPGQSAGQRADDDHRRRQDRPVHRARRDRIPGPRPVQDRHPARARQGRGTRGQPQPGWNRKLVITHGGSCGTDRSVGERPDVLNEDGPRQGLHGHVDGAQQPRPQLQPGR